ncbi:MAG: hypothetical protein M8319_03635 [Nitrosopumilus sp.]|nr:hypothetical protein [Nitrosopumilus sp.]
MMIKEVYHKIRLGQAVVFPVLSMINFIIISYSLTTIKDIIPIHFYIPIFAVALISMLMVIGSIFHNKQQSTDFNMNFRKQTSLIKSIRLMLESQPNKTPETETWIKELKKMEDDHAQ